MQRKNEVPKEKIVKDLLPRKLACNERVRQVRGGNLLKLVLTLLLIIRAMTWPEQVEAASLTLTWTHDSGDADGFVIERFFDSAYAVLAIVGADVRSYTDSDLIGGTIYCYRMKAFNSVGDSNYSEEACATATVSTNLSASPTTIAAGGTITAIWSGITAPTTTDWIGLYTPMAGDGTFIDWIYVSCSKTAVSAQPNGQCPFTLPTTLAAGTYELRLFANDGYTRLATSNSFTVSQ